MSYDILIIDDEADIRDLLSGILSDEGYETKVASDADAAIAMLKNAVPRLIFLDIWLEGSRIDGMALLTFIKNNYPDLPVVMISGHGTIDTAVSAIKRGAYDFIEKPFALDKLLLAVERALETFSLRAELTQLKKRAFVAPEMVGVSAAIKNLRQNIEKVAATNSRIMLFGPSGSGKELAARVIHHSSLRAQAPFVILNAATLTAENMMHDLFGGSDADGSPNIGVLEEANNGTLYIDEVADLPMEVQAKMLSWLVNHHFKSTSKAASMQSDVRLISSTSQDIKALVQQGRFREDLYHRLAVVPVSVPALCERREDIPLLVKHFVKQIAAQSGIKPRQLSADAVIMLQGYNWEGNVRQLKNHIERLLILARSDNNSDVITADMLPEETSDPIAKTLSDKSHNIMTMQIREAREVFEKNYILAQMERFDGNISKTADNIGMERSALHRKLKGLGVKYKI
ncbi:sigma-54 dependent transcriptional regulator [Bartonella sp. TP]|uniref:nitrogen assimilation response regulator NtrX n=1 Tax=Bartonella sp. TP TaxID=3057550 RepID=UPI0025B00F03|nr:sigma-54 dependent transcriptional regulator [Bartonella sp. TP]WJW80087.1 sigma-54 dependent transcriptional regulator [Bartonella sp. TP]